MAEVINIPNIKNITDYMAELADSGKKPVYTPIYPQVYEGRQAIINADRIIFNARLASDQGEKATYSAGGDIHMFSQNFISLSTRGSIHLNTEHPEGVAQEENNVNFIMINAPNIFLGMDDMPEGGKNKPSVGQAQVGCHNFEPSFSPFFTIDCIFFNCTGATIAPISIDLSSGFPTRSFSIRAFNFLINNFSTLS